MPTIDAHDPGTICWIDLASTDAAGATEFYCELFGWTATEPIENAGGYRMLLHDGRQVAGLAPVWGDTDGSAWSTYVASADADETCAAAVASGGDVVMDAMDVLTAGRMAVLRDPAGAQVSVWQAGDHQGYEVHGEPGTPIWSELMTRDLASAARLLPRPSSAGRRSRRTSTASRYTVWKRSGQLVGGALEMDETWPEETQSALDGLHRDGRLRRDGAALRRARRHGLASRRTTSAPAAARCWRTPRAATFSVIQLRLPARRPDPGVMHPMQVRYARSMPSIEIRTEIPGPRSRAWIERKERVVANAKAPVGAGLRRARRGRARHGRRRQHVHRLRRRHRLPRRRALQRRRHGGGAGAGRALPAHRLHDHALRLVRRAGRAAVRAPADLGRDEGRVLQQRRRGRRERRQDRQGRHRPAGRDRLRGRLPRAHAHGDVADLEAAPVQGGLRAVRARGLPRRLSVRVPLARRRRRRRGRARRPAPRLHDAHRAGVGGGDRDRADPGRGRLRPGAGRLPARACASSATSTASC